MNALTEALLADLRAFAADLLEPGLAPAARSRRTSPAGGGIGALVEESVAFATLVPRLLDDLDVGEYSFREDEHVTTIPVRAALPRRAADYVMAGGRLLPQRWVTHVPVLEADLRPLGWLLHLIGLMRQRLDEGRRRLAKPLEEAARSRRGTSFFARLDQEALRELQGSLDRARSELDKAAGAVVARAGLRLVPTQMFPRPFPRAPSWATLRRLADPLIRPLAALPAVLRGLLGREPMVADLPFLYQRWCGVKVVAAMEGLGFELHDDPTPALFLGGRIRFRKPEAAIELWCEPRLAREVDHESGLFPTRAEATPDYVFLAPGPGGEDAFILDPTLDHEPEVRSGKARYLSALAFRKRPLVAGVPTLRHPLRSWAAAPLDLAHCVLESSDGTKGTVPMNPARYHDAPLRHWLADLEAHARAWRRARPEAPPPAERSGPPS